MIRNLNQVSFQGYGTIQPERGNTPKFSGLVNRRTMELAAGDAPVYRAKADTWFRFGAGMSVLSVSLDGEDFHHFYLDKTVCVRENVYFSLSAFRDTASAEMLTSQWPEPVGVRGIGNLQVKPRFRVTELYTFFYQEKEQGFLFPGEAHPMPELTYVDQGSLHSVVDGQDLLLEQGDIVLYGPGQFHMQYSDIGVAPRFVTIVFDLDDADLMPLLNRKFKAPQSVVTLLQRMLREQELMDDYSGGMIISQISALLHLLLREADGKTAVKIQSSNAIHSENEIIRQAQLYINGNIRKKLSVPLVARQVDVSPSYLTALFHKNLQISPGEYIRRIKLQESKQVIRESDLNFTEIAAALQYSTVHHFSRQFKEKFGITPTEYAKSVR